MVTGTNTTQCWELSGCLSNRRFLPSLAPCQPRVQLWARPASSAGCPRPGSPRRPEQPPPSQSLGRGSSSCRLSLFGSPVLQGSGEQPWAAGPGLAALPGGSVTLV